MIVVTGANGFIGSAMVWELNNQGHTNIIACDSVDLKQKPSPLTKYKFEHFIHRDELFDFLENNISDLEGIFHMGACSTTTEMDEEFLRRNNTEYSNSLFEICTRANVPFIYASSASVYGDGSKGFDDKEPTENYIPLHPYGRSKAQSDIWMTQQSQTPSRWYALRFFNVYGPNEYHKGSMLSVPYKAYFQVLENHSIKLFKSNHPDYADGEQMRDFVYIKDITRWMYELYHSATAQSGIYNMGFGQARTWKDLAHAVFASLDQEPNIELIEIPDNLKNQYQNFTEADMQKWRKQGLSKPMWSLELGVKDYVQNYLAKDISSL